MKIKLKIVQAIALCLAFAMAMQHVQAETKQECLDKCWNRYNEDMETCDINAAQNLVACMLVCIPAAPSGIGYLACVAACDLAVLISRNQCYAAAETAKIRCDEDCPEE